MDSRKYSEKRNELLGIMDEVLKIEGISERRIIEFQRIRKKCLENQFNIVLIGEFQGGKSTTFNAFCGGREISPRGAMIKTSACRITATNISESDKEEFAYVQWKSDSELLINIQSILNKYISQEQTDFNPESKELYEPSRYLKLSNPAHVKIIKDAINEEWKVIKASPETHTDEAEICRIADVILHFYTESGIQELMKRNYFTIEDVSRFAVFPKEWEKKWNDGKGVEAFAPNEILFAFVSGIDCYIHSQNLERLGCTVTDCPGLFTSAWDTQVAFNTLPQADAVIYLLSGEKQLSDGDKKALSYIKRIGLIEDKMFFAINMRKVAKITENILSTDHNILCSLGFSNVYIKRFNAQLFFLGEFGQHLLESKLDDFSKKRFRDVASEFGNEEESLEQLWVSSVWDVQAGTKNQELKRIQDLTLKSVDVVFKASENRDMFDEIEKFIIDKKAYSILVESGANVVKRSLGEVEAELANQEMDALKDVAACEAEYAAAQLTLTNFQDDVKRILDNAFPESVVETVVSKAYDKIIRNDRTITNIALKTSMQLIPVLGVKCKGKALMLKVLELGAKAGIRGLDEQQKKQIQFLEGVITPVVTDVIKSEVGTNVSAWVMSVFNGQDKEYREEIIPKLEKVSEMINKKWENSLQENSSIKAFELTIPPESMSEVKLPSSIVNIDKSSITGAAVDVAIDNIIKDLIRTLITLVVSILVGVVVDFWLLGGLGHALAALYAALVWIFSTILGKDGEERPIVTNSSELKKGERKIYDALYPVLSSSFNKEETIAKIKVALSSVPNKVISLYRQYYNMELNQQRNLLNEDIAKRRANKQQSVQAQKEIARKARKKREEEITPVLEQLDGFINSCSE